MPDADWLPYLTAAGVLLFHLFGVLHVVHAVMNVRTSQGTIAWIVSLLALPWIAVPISFMPRATSARR